jgi:hypothetical protein
MYQKEVATKEINIEFLELAASVAEWSVTRYGYFVNSHVDKVETIKAFAEELSRLPKESLRFVDKAKNTWIDEGHPRPPQMADFLTLLRGFNNVGWEERARLEKKQQLIKPNSPYSATAHAWDHTADKDRYEFLKGLRNRKVSAATKWVMGQWMKDKNFEEKRIRSILR